MAMNLEPERKRTRLQRLATWLGRWLGTLKPVAIFAAALLVGLVAFNACTFRVGMTQQAVVSRFNRVIRVVVDKKTPELVAAIESNPQLKGVHIDAGKGLFLKVPFLDSVDYYLNTLLTYDTDPREVITKDKKKVILDNFAQWRIVNPALFKISMKTDRVAHQRIDDILYSKLNEEIGKIEASRLIADKTYVLAMMDLVAQSTNAELAPYGMQIVDVRIKRTDLPKENSANIFARMRTEREQQAKRYRSEGEEEAQKIRSDADKQAQIIVSEAYAKAEQIKGEGEAEAARIYADAYNRDPEFYRFYRTLQAYKQTITSSTKIVVPANSEFAKFLFGIK